MYAALGIHGCMPHSHGSQGCCAYHRSHLTRHFKEPVVATTSSFTEGASVFGGLANMTQALSNIFTIYNPKIVAVHTTCLSEVIGDDIPMMIKKATEEGIIPAGKCVIHANTPSFVGSHVTGFASMVTGMVKYLAESSGKTEAQLKDEAQLNLIPGFIDPADMRELKRIVKEMGVKTVMFPDTSGVLDLPQDGRYRMFPSGGATIEEIKSAGDSVGTIALGHFASHPAATELDEKCKVPCALLELPYGLTNTDRFIHALRNHGGVDVPATIGEERGRLLDAMSDMHQYFHGKRVAIVGDPDHVIALTQFLVELDMKPAYVITGSPGNHFEQPRDGDSRRPRARRHGEAERGLVRAASMDQEPAGGPHHRQHLLQIHFPRGKHPVRAFRLPGAGPHGPPLLPQRRLHGRAAPHGKNERRAARPQRPRVPRGKLRTHPVKMR